MVFNALDQRAADIARHRENRGRLATAFGAFATTAAETGSIVFRERVDFEVVYTEQPAMSYGCAFSLDDYIDGAGLDEGLIPQLPMTAGYVTEWDLTGSGLYEGAWCAVRIDWPDASIAVPMDHHFTFAGTALKNVDPELGED